MKRAERSKRAWSRKYKELLQYYEQHGNVRVPSRYKPNPSLGAWVQKQRVFKDRLDKDQIRRLEDLKFVWSEDIRKEKRAQWMELYRRLRMYKKIEGHCRVPSKNEFDPKLGRWVETQRLNLDKLESWKVDMLNALDFEWSEDIVQKNNERWFQMYDRLCQFHKIYGHSQVPENYDKDPELAIWVIGQRRPKVPQSADRKKLLDDIQFLWNNEPRMERVRNDKGRYVANI